MCRFAECRRREDVVGVLRDAHRTEEVSGVVAPDTRCGGGVLVEELDHTDVDILGALQLVGTGDGCGRRQAVHSRRLVGEQRNHRVVGGGPLAAGGLVDGWQPSTRRQLSVR